ncbi:MAG: itaconyl-CoA hydratase [Paralcaligenes sp.]
MTAIDATSWIGRTETCADRIDVGHVEKMAFSLDVQAPKQGDALPLLWQWGLFVKGYAYDELGEDGHPCRGGFAPPADNRNRMWAGGRLEFPGILRVGVGASRVSTIIAVEEKTGRSGKLLFVTIKHEYFQNGLLCISEEQDVVYREPSPPKLSGTDPAPQAEWAEDVVPTSTMLFRYSAVTFNGHRIHYDYPYATQVEGYPGLVVHGPMIATLMCRAFSRANPGRVVTSLSYRGMRPLFAPRAFQVAGALTDTGRARLWAEQDGTLAHQAEVRFVA